MTYQIVTRSQHSRGSRSGRFGGPDQYMAVLVIPEGVTSPYALRADSLRKRGIEFHYVGEFYGKSTGPRSRYAQCAAEARELVASLQAQ